MFVRNLKLFNLRSFEKLEIELSSAINVLIGNNNSGKSTIIKSIYQIQNSSILRPADVRKTENEGSILVTINGISSSDHDSFRAQDIAIAKTSEASVVLSTWFKSYPTDTNVQRHISNSTQIKAINSKGLIAFKEGHNGVMGQHTCTTLNNTETTNNFIYTFLATRKINSYANRVDFKDMYTITDDFRFLLAQVKKISNPGHPRNQEFFELCQEILGLRVGIIPENDNQENIGLFITNSETISIQQMGEGVLHVLGLVVMLLTEDRKLYLLEEPENELHPKALKALLELIIKKSENNQFIVSTHSNIVLKYLGGLENSKVFETNLRFEKSNRNTKIILPTTNAVEIKNSPEERIRLLEKLGYDLFDFELHKGYLVLEESSAEAIITNFLIPEFVPQLRQTLKTIAASGVDDVVPRFHTFLRLFVFVHSASVYNRKAWVVVDGDEKGTKIINDLRTKFDKWPQEHFLTFSKKNFEEFYPDLFLKKFQEIQRKEAKLKRIAKRDLTLEVLEWVKNSREVAIESFSKSAFEVIEILRSIAVALGQESSQLNSNTHAQPENRKI